MKKLELSTLATVSGGCCIIQPVCGGNRGNQGGCGNQGGNQGGCGQQRNSCCS